jgi:hypothetical protein
MPTIHIQPFEAASITLYMPFPEGPKTIRNVVVLMMTEGFVDFTYDCNDLDGTIHHRDCFSGQYYIEANFKESIYDSPVNRGF